MGSFNPGNAIKGAIGGGVAGFIRGGPKGAAVGAALGGTVGGFSGKSKKFKGQPPIFNPEERREIGERLFTAPTFNPIHVPMVEVRPQDSVFFQPFQRGLDQVSGRIAALNSTVGGFRSVLDDLPELREQIAALQATVRPGFSDIRKARVTAVDNARQRTLSNIRDDLGRRGLGGSSFAVGAQIRGERTFAQERAAQEAQSFLEELSANIQLIDQDRQVLQLNLAGLGEIADAQTAQLQGEQQRLAEISASLRQDVASKTQAAIANQQAAVTAQIAEIEAQLKEIDSQREFFIGLEQVSAGNAQAAAKIAAEESSGLGEFIGGIAGSLFTTPVRPGTTSSGGGGGSGSPFTTGFGAGSSGIGFSQSAPIRSVAPSFSPVGFSQSGSILPINASNINTSLFARAF